MWYATAVALTFLLRLVLVTATSSCNQQFVAEEVCDTQAGGQDDVLTLLQWQHEPQPAEVMGAKAFTRTACASLVFVFASLLASLSVHWARVDGPVEVARSLFILLLGYYMLSYSIVILDAYQLSISLSKDATFSGLVISVYQFGTASGSCVTWFLLKCQPMLWRRYSKSVLLLSLFVHCLGAVGYTMVCQNTPHSASVKWLLAALLVGSRYVSGFGSGFWWQLGELSIARLTPGHQRPYQVGRVVLATTVGLGLGPVISALCSSITSIAAASAAAVDFAVIGIVQVVMAVVLSIAIACNFPDLTSAKDFLQEEEETRIQKQPKQCGQPRAGSTWLGQVVLVVACITMACCRAFGVSSLEVASSLVLEVSYKWSPRAIGLAIAIPAFGTVPLRLAQAIFVRQFTDVSWIRLLSCVCWVSALLLSFVEHGTWIVALDCVLFPLLYWSDAQAKGIMQQHFFPEGSWLDANNATLWRQMTCLMVRFLGPIAARWEIMRGGLDMYAVQQALTIGMFWTMFELAVLPNMNSAVLQT